MSFRILSAAVLSLTASTVAAEPLTIVTDILPVQSLVEGVAGDLADVTVLMQPGVSPHDYAMRPSDVQALTNADVVIWVGHPLTPILEDPIDRFVKDAVTLELLDTPGWLPLETRGVDDHDDLDGHDHGAIDPHAWLSPQVLQVWTSAISNALGEADPEHASQYALNATQVMSQITEVQIAAEDLLAPVRGRPFVVSHDGFQYFETAFDMPSTGRIAPFDAASPGATHLAELQTYVRDNKIECILTDPQSNQAWAKLVTEGTDAHIAVVDPLGGSFENSSNLAGSIILDIAAVLSDCLKE